MVTLALPGPRAEHSSARRAGSEHARRSGNPTSASFPARGASLEWLDLLRIGAILAVVVIHTVSAATRKSGTGWHGAWWWAADVLNSACLWCVPVFVMVSGALLLDPERRVPGVAFLRRRAVRLGVPLVFWIAAYLVFQCQFYGQGVTSGDTFRSVASGAPFLQLYFLFIMAGLTVLTPVLRRLVRHCNRRELLALTAAALTFGLCEHLVRALGGGGGFNAVTRCLPYVGYYLAGYLLRTATLSERTQRLSRRLFLVGWLATALGSGALSARYGWTNDGYFLFDYLSPTVMLMSLAVFTAARSWQPKRISQQTLRRYGSATFGVFLIHPLLLFPLMRSLRLPDAADIGRTVVWALPLSVGVCLATTVIALAVSRIPLLRRLIS